MPTAKHVLMCMPLRQERPSTASILLSRSNQALLLFFGTVWSLYPRVSAHGQTFDSGPVISEEQKLG